MLSLRPPFPLRPERAVPALWAVAALAWGPSVGAQESAAPDLAPLGAQISELARSSTRTLLPQARVQVEVGTLDPRLRLAPCRRIEPYLPAGLPAWGRTRVGMRCVDGPKPWNVSLPVTVHVWAPSMVLTTALPAGTVLESSHLREAEVDLAASTSRAVQQLPLALGRSLARALPEGAALRQNDLKARQLFAAGETVRLVAVGPGWRIHGEGQAVTPGLEGQTARVRTEGGRVVQGRPSGDREMEVSL